PGGRSPVNPVANANEEMQGEAGDGRAKREVAQRVFAAEFNAAAHSFKESGDRSPTFVVSPFGAKVNRLFAVGVLTSTESVGASGDRYRAQVVDPTGVFNVYAGQYEPEATAQLTEIRPPAVVAIVGKSRTYQPESGVTYVSVRPESIHAVAKADRDAWILDTARHSMQRLDALREAQKMETPTPNALESLLPGGAEKMGAVPEFAPAAASMPAPKAAAPKAPAAPPKAAASANEDVVMALCEKLDDGKGAPWEDVVAEAARKGIGEAEVEECLNALMDKGQVYEPVLGRLKRT